MKILIIEDEAFTAKDLENTILSLVPEAIIVDIIPSVEAGLHFFSEPNSVDLIFSDIELGDGKSFEIFEKYAVQTPIIFCTAYNEYALKAFDTAGISYILKPFSKETILKAIDRYRFLQPKPQNNLPSYTEVLSALQNSMRPAKLPSIIVHKADKIIPVSGEDIALFYIDNGVVRAFTFKNELLLVSPTLDELETKFVPYYFRANRQYLINRSAVKEASQHFNRKLLVHLSVSFNEQILIGKEKSAAFLVWLANV